MLVVLVVALGVALLAGLVHDFNVDSWLELVTGRVVWQHGIPHHETLTVISLGHTWTDQQWISQLAGYALYLIGGLGLVGLVNVGLIVAAVGGATLAARRFGGSARAVLLLLPVCLLAILPSSEVRTQEFILPLYVLVTWLLISDCHTPSRRVLWCLPILVLWANLHGTVTLGAALVALRGLILAWERRTDLRHRPAAWLRPLMLTVGSAVAITLTPYGVSIIAYYRTTMASGTLRHFVSEWGPLTTSPVVACAVFAVAALALWSFGRNPANTTAWEKIALLALCAMTISVVRNAVFFSLLALIVVPRSLADPTAATATRGLGRSRGLINGLLVLSVTVAALIAVAVTLARPGAKIENSFLAPKLLTAVRGAERANPYLRILAQNDYSDWLLWKDPALSGRIADDARFELLSADQISSLNNVYSASGTHWMRGARGYRMLVLDRTADHDSITAFEHQPGSRVLYRGPQAVVVLRTAAGARA